MRLNAVFVATMLAIGSASANAGDFTNVPFTSPLATVVEGANNPAVDQLYINTTSASWLAGYTNLIAETINYNATGGSGTLSLLSFRENDDIELGGNEIGDLYDLVYRDSRDGKLVFGTRVLLEEEDEEESALVAANEEEEEEVELNFVYRGGFNTFATAAAWTFTTDDDLRMYNAARTASYELDGPFESDPDLIRFQADISPEEGNPFSGLYLVKTDATAYALRNSAIGYFQAGEEGQAITGEFIAGFAPVAAVPEPETYAMMLAGLGLVGFVARRRSKFNV